MWGMCACQREAVGGGDGPPKGEDLCMGGCANATFGHPCPACGSHQGQGGPRPPVLGSLDEGVSPPQIPMALPPTQVVVLFVVGTVWEAKCAAI